MSEKAVTVFGPDFPFAYDQWLTDSAGLGSIPEHQHGAEVAIIGAGVSGMVAAFELMKLGLKPVTMKPDVWAADCALSSLAMQPG